MRWWGTVVLALAAACGSDPSSVGASIVAQPDPLIVCDGSRHGQVRISWFREGMGLVQVRVGAVDGDLFASGPPHGSALTGKWVTDGLSFYLLDADSGELLAQTRVSVQTDCR